MIIHSVFDKEFRRFGQVLQDYDFSELIDVLNRSTPRPEDAVVYVASDAALEALPAADLLMNRAYGGMPIQIGYCNGTNSKLNCFEYHRDSEINIAADDSILLVACQGDLDNHTLDTSSVEAFFMPVGTAVEVFATTLHYAPCSAEKGKGFRMVIVLPKGTNTEKPAQLLQTGEDRLCTARNKWLIAHPESNEAKNGAFIGLTGENIDLFK